MSGEGTEAAGIAGALSVLRSLNLQDLDYELRKLQAVKEWALTHLGIDYRAGDQVRIISPLPGQSTGWAHKAECLHVGATGIVGRIDFAPPFGDRPGRWFADFVPDREWSTSSTYPPGETRRYWKGRVSETPEGYEPPSKYDAETYPEGRRHTFMFNVDWLTAAAPESPAS